MGTLGDCEVGKTMVLYRYIGMRFREEYKQSFGMEFMIKQTPMGQFCILQQIWDVAGTGIDIDCGWNAVFRGTDGCVLVYDVNKKETFDHIDEYRSYLLERAKIDKGKHDKFPFLLLANECDLYQNECTVLTSGYCRRSEIKSDLNIPLSIQKMIERMIPSDGLLYASQFGNMLYYEVSSKK